MGDIWQKALENRKNQVTTIFQNDHWPTISLSLKDISHVLTLDLNNIVRQIYERVFPYVRYPSLLSAVRQIYRQASVKNGLQTERMRNRRMETPKENNTLRKSRPSDGRLLVQTSKNMSHKSVSDVILVSPNQRRNLCHITSSLFKGETYVTLHRVYSELSRGYEKWDSYYLPVALEGFSLLKLENLRSFRF